MHLDIQLHGVLIETRYVIPSDHDRPHSFVEALNAECAVPVVVQKQVTVVVLEVFAVGFQIGTSLAAVDDGTDPTVDPVAIFDIPVWEQGTICLDITSLFIFSAQPLVTMCASRGNKTDREGNCHTYQATCYTADRSNLKYTRNLSNRVAAVYAYCR